MPDSPVNRHSTIAVRVGSVLVGGNAPVVVQSMTNTDTADVGATTEQVLQLAQAGSELVRLTVNTEAAAQAVPEIRQALEKAGCHVPLVGISTSTVTNCWSSIRPAPRPWRSTGSTPVMSDVAPSGMTSSPL